MFDGLEVAVIVGVTPTFTVNILVLVQAPVRPVTVYIVVVEGVTMVVAPVVPPGFQVYEVAPVAVNVELPPLQITVGLAEAVKLKFVTVSVTVLVLVHPATFVPVTV